MSAIQIIAFKIPYSILFRFSVKAQIPVFKFERGLLSRLKKLSAPIDLLGVKFEILLRKSSFSRSVFIFYLVSTIFSITVI